jgi:transposase
MCQEPSKRVHSHYQRTLQDLPWGHLRVQLRLLVHRFFCDNPCCIRKIFTERLDDLAEPYARRTNRLRDALLAIGWALGGEAGARHSQRQAVPVGASTLLALLRLCKPSDLFHTAYLILTCVQM